MQCGKQLQMSGDFVAMSQSVTFEFGGFFSFCDSVSFLRMPPSCPASTKGLPRKLKMGPSLVRSSKKETVEKG